MNGITEHMNINLIRIPTSWGKTNTTYIIIITSILTKQIKTFHSYSN